MKKFWRQPIEMDDDEKGMGKMKNENRWKIKLCLFNVSLKLYNAHLSDIFCEKLAGTARDSTYDIGLRGADCNPYSLRSTRYMEGVEEEQETDGIQLLIDFLDDDKVWQAEIPLREQHYFLIDGEEASFDERQLEWTEKRAMKGVGEENMSEMRKKDLN